jgi:hypothetical protein
MSSILNFIKNLPDTSADNIVSDVNYIRKSSLLVSESLQKGADIMQMPNGDIHVTETKVVTYRYEWNREKSRFERASSGVRSRRKRKINAPTPLNQNQKTNKSQEVETETSPLLEKIA